MVATAAGKVGYVRLELKNKRVRPIFLAPKLSSNKEKPILFAPKMTLDIKVFGGDGDRSRLVMSG